jgi:ketosteroid isomerase-like protein
MQPSPDVRALIEQNFRDLAAKDADAILVLGSNEPGVVFVGTDPKEWFESLAAMEPVIRATAASGSGNMPADLYIQALQEGTVGWAAYHWTGHFPDGRTIQLRGTSVCHQESGVWKTVHTHWSVAVPDELVMNIAQPPQ